MPEKVRVSPAPSRQLSTGAVVQAALVPEDDEPLEDDEEDPDEEEPDDEPDPFDDELEEEPEDEDSDFAGTELLPEDRLSVR